MTQPSLLSNTSITSTLLLLMVSALMVTLVACDSDPASTKQNEGKKPRLVEVAKVIKKQLDISQTRTGTLRARREVKIHNQEEGEITALPVYEGDQVKQGDLLVQLDDKLLRSQLMRARATRKQAEQDLARTTNLFKKKLVADEELSRAETQLQIARADEEVLTTRLSYTTIKSPLTGIVSQRLSEPGNIAERYSHLLTISDPTSLVTDVTLSGLLISKLALNQTADVLIDALGNKRHKGRIHRIYPDLDPVTRRGTIEIELRPVPAGARPGQLCRVTIRTQAADRVVIPFSALRRDNKGEYVYTVNKESKVKRSTVTTGLRIGELVEIIDGLSPDTNVVTKGFLGLSEGKEVDIVSRTSDKVSKKDMQHQDPSQ